MEMHNESKVKIEFTLFNIWLPPCCTYYSVCRLVMTVLDRLRSRSSLPG